MPTLLSLVAAGVGVYLPIQFFSRLALPGVVYRPVEDAPLVEIVAVWQREAGGRTPVVRAFLSVAREALDAQEGAPADAGPDGPEGAPVPSRFR